jgi:hypothetical protein
MAVTALQLIQTVESAGAHFMVDGDRLGIFPATAVHPMLEELRSNKFEIIALLQHRLVMPQGVRLLQWEPLAPPIQLNRYTSVLDTEKFAAYTLRQLGARLRGDNWGAGSWSVWQLLERLERVGVTVELLENS